MLSLIHIYKGSTTIKGALNELDMAGLLERERGGFLSLIHISTGSWRA